jgi:hypothetical protein
MNNLLFSMAIASEKLLAFLTTSLGSWYLIILNAFGVLAIACKIFEYQVKKRDTMFVLVITASLLWVAYFIFYGDFSSALTCLIGAIRLLIFMQRGKHKWADSIWWLVFFLALQTVVSIFTYKIWQDVFSITAGYVGILAYFMIDPKKYRALSFLHMALWVANSALKFYPIALISDSVSVISVTVAIIRFSIAERKDRKMNEFIDKQNNKTLD